MSSHALPMFIILHLSKCLQYLVPFRLVPVLSKVLFCSRNLDFFFFFLYWATLKLDEVPNPAVSIYLAFVKVTNISATWEGAQYYNANFMQEEIIKTIHSD